MALVDLHNEVPMAEVYMAKATKEKLDELHNHKLNKTVYKQNNNKRKCTPPVWVQSHSYKHIVVVTVNVWSVLGFHFTGAQVVECFCLC